MGSHVRDVGWHIPRCWPHRRQVIFCVVLVCGVPTGVAAQAGNASSLNVRQPQAGDCTLTIEVPAGTDTAGVRIALDSATAPLRFTVAQRTPLVAAIKDPLLANSDIVVTVGTLSVTKRVAAAPDGAVVPVSCAPPIGPRFDEREVFETSAFLGEVFDNFAPNVVGGYIGSPTDLRSRWTAGVESQYRVIGTQESQAQLWLGGYVLHGLRTTDVRCGDTPDATQCKVPDPAKPEEFLSKDVVKNYFYVLHGASTMEAHVDMRLEFLTLQKESKVPARLYAVARSGFLDLAGAPRVYDTSELGVGALVPKGVFRGSSAQIGLGQSKQFETDQRFHRTKLDAVLVFDVLPGLSAQGILSRLGAGSRFFIAISIDRNFRDGPDAVQTYVGADFDLRRLFGSF